MTSRLADGRARARSGRFGEFGGRFVPETLVPACMELEAAFREAWGDPRSGPELDEPARRLRRAAHARSPSATGSRSELGVPACCSSARTSTHTGSHKINNVLGQALLARAHGQDAG